MKMVAELGMLSGFMRKTWDARVLGVRDDGFGYTT